MIDSTIFRFRLYLMCLFSVCMVTLASPSSGMIVKDVVFTPRVELGSTTLRLHNAALLRYMKLIDAYVAALYLPEGVHPSHVLSDVPKRLEISYLVSIKGRDFDKGAKPALERNLSPVEMRRLQDRIDRINAVYEDVKPGDRYSLTYVPGRGTELALNNRALVNIEGADFAAAYFGIWLGQKPVDEKLKQDLLRSR